MEPLPCLCQIRGLVNARILGSISSLIQAVLPLPPAPLPFPLSPLLLPHDQAPSVISKRAGQNSRFARLLVVTSKSTRKSLTKSWGRNCVTSTAKKSVLQRLAARSAICTTKTRNSKPESRNRSKGSRREFEPEAEETTPWICSSSKTIWRRENPFSCCLVSQWSIGHDCWTCSLLEA